MAGKKSSLKKTAKKTSPSSHKSSKQKKKGNETRQNNQIVCQKHFFQNSDCTIFRSNLLAWYGKNQRKLPWRDIAKHEPDANIRGYAVWVSEIMLQQTQVATVIPYFNKWIKKWPTVKNLASSSLEEVLKMWSGLGYYSRGRRLHEGANIIVSQLDGKIPDTAEELVKTIPGIGAYSASAIASVAFQKPVGVVDGNVIRVLSRMKTLGAPITQTGVRDHLWSLANEIVSPEWPGDFNQALMELGAVVCTPQNPNCSTCPVSNICMAYSMSKKNASSSQIISFVSKKSQSNKEAESNVISNVPDIESIVGCPYCLPAEQWKKNPQVTAFPCKVEKKAPRLETVYVSLIEQSGKFLMFRRPDKGLLAGLWEFPSILDEEKTASNKQSNHLTLLLNELGLNPSYISNQSSLGEVVHLFSHIHSTYIVDHIILKPSGCIHELEKETMWATEEDIKTAAISTAMKKVFALLKKGKESVKNSGQKRKRTQEDTKQKSMKSFLTVIS